MPRDENAAALENARDDSTLVNAILVAKALDPRRTAAGLLVIIKLLIGNDTVGRIAMAALLCEASAELLSGIPLDQLHDTVNVPRYWN